MSKKIYMYIQGYEKGKLKIIGLLKQFFVICQKGFLRSRAKGFFDRYIECKKKRTTRLASLLFKITFIILNNDKPSKILASALRTKCWCETAQLNNVPSQGYG